MFKKLGETTYLQIIFVGLVILIGTIALLFIAYGVSALMYGLDTTQGVLLGSINSKEEISVLKILQFVNQLSIFVLPVLALMWFIRKDNPNFICFRKVPDISQFFAVILLFVASIPVIQYSLQLNSQMHLPESMQAIQDWMKYKENIAANLTNKFMETTEFSSYFVNLLVMAIMPAIGEELIFRGLLTRWIGKITKNIHVNILITSFIFSAFHIQFFGFIPRFLLGMILGYTYYFTQSIWPSILLHFINNAVTVSIYFYVFRSKLGVKPEDVGTVDNLYLVIVSTAAVIGILAWMKKQAPAEKCLE